jgi:membrane protein DedA with SNARE-associated domain
MTVRRARTGGEAVNEIVDLIAHYGLVLVFVNVFLLQAGVPVPAVPTLMAAGALAAGGAISPAALVVVAVIASLAGDLVWYVAGRIYGMRVLRFFCRMSLSPDACVRDTQNRFQRWGAPSLIVAKFVPGFGTVAPPLAGALKLALTPFLAYSAVSATLWSGLAVGAGLLFHDQIDWLLHRLEDMGLYAVAVLAAILVLFVAAKWWERQRFFAELRMARITPADLYHLMTAGRNPIVADVRAAADRRADPRRVPGAVALDPADPDAGLKGLPPDQDIILYCT